MDTPPSSTSSTVFEVLEARSLLKRPLLTKIADHLTSASSTPFFLLSNVGFFSFWILWNTGYFAFLPIVDPYPFGLLTMAVSLEAIVLSIFVLISQKRAAQIATLREELHLRINEIAEQETTKCLELLSQLRHHAGIDTPDEELDRMLQPINEKMLEERIAKQLQEADTAIVREFVGNHILKKKTSTTL